MATIDFVNKEVRQALRVIVGVSQRVRALVESTLVKMEANPAQFEPLAVVPEALRNHPVVCIRKAKIRHQKHDYRMLFLHFKPPEGEEHVTILQAFPRQEDYHIDWDWVDQVIRDVGE